MPFHKQNTNGMVDVLVKKKCVDDCHSLSVSPWAQSPDPVTDPVFLNYSTR